MGMSYQNLSIVAVRALQRNKMRTFLTCLGIIIGVLSVILLIGVSNSSGRRAGKDPELRQQLHHDGGV